MLIELLFQSRGEGALAGDTAIARVPPTESLYALQPQAGRQRDSRRSAVATDYQTPLM